MQGWLDVLEGGARKAWTRRFLALNAAFQVLEVFQDADQQQRVDRLDLGAGARVATADELGEALRGGTRLSVESSRRFVLRVTPAGRSQRHVYLCAEVAGDAAAGRARLDLWLRALRRAVDAAGAGAGAMPDDPRSLAAFAERLHLSAAVVARREAPGSPAQYELLVTAWVLARELAGREDGREAWQVLEYSSTWRVARSSAQLRAWDADMRQFAGRELRDVAFPSVGASVSPSRVVARLLHAADEQAADADSRRRVALYDAYLQRVLRLPALSMAGSDVGAVLDAFLEVPAHLSALRKAERDAGASLHLSQRRVVPWATRARFEELHAGLEQQQQAREQRVADAEAARDREPAEPRRHHHHHHHQQHRHHHSDADRREQPEARTCAPVAPLPAPVEVSPGLAAGPQGETPASVEERIARVGHKLIAEAFSLPSRPRAAEPSGLRGP